QAAEIERRVGRELERLARQAIEVVKHARLRRASEAVPQAQQGRGGHGIRKGLPGYAVETHGGGAGQALDQVAVVSERAAVADRTPATGKAAVEQRLGGVEVDAG